MARRLPDDVRFGAHRRRARSRVRSRVWATLFTLAVAAAACKSGPDLSLDYAQSARENYELALGEFADEDWDEAIQYADFVRIRFPFSRYAVEAELLIARSEFHQGNYLTAQDAFRQFAKLHPTHKHVRNGWVSYMAAVSAYMNGPQRFFLLPPAPQRDQSQLKEALAELEYFFDHHSDTPTVKYAIGLRDEIKRRLLDHELYVANFYLDRDRPEAAIGRLEAAHRNYPGIGLDAEVLFLLGITYLRLDEVELARATFTELQNQHPKHHRGRQARVYLRYIYDTYGPADPSRPRPDRKLPVPKPPARPKNKARPEVPVNTPPVTERRVGTGSRTSPAARPPAKTAPEAESARPGEAAGEPEAPSEPPPEPEEPEIEGQPGAPAEDPPEAGDSDEGGGS
jgi:outer membrane assembly lipoprotein YfiO